MEGAEAGCEAADRGDWSEAYALLSRADDEGELSALTLEYAGDAAFWTGRLRECIGFRERSATAYTRAEDCVAAARVAIGLGMNHFWLRNYAVGGGWFAKARRWLADSKPEGPVHGELAIWQAHMKIAGGKLDDALTATAGVFELGQRLGNADLQAHALCIEGAIRVRLGEVERGMALIDESMASAVAGELGQLTTATIYCTTISACNRIGDYRRAAEWTDVAEGCTVRPGMSEYPGDCNAHRVGVLRMRGTWDDAEREAERAIAVEGSDSTHIGMALYEVGEIHLRRGDLDLADTFFERADDHGRTPQPGRALLLLARGRIGGARASITGSLADEVWDRLARSRLLPAAVEIAVAGDDLEQARAAAEELREIAETYGTPAIEATSRCALGAVHLAAGDAASAATELRKGWRLWQEVDAPYELARARLLLGDALAAQGDTDGAAAEARATKSIFERLGARPDLARADEAQSRFEAAPIEARAGEERIVRTFMFTDIVGSTNLVEAIGDEAWMRLLRWHDQALRTQFAKHAGKEIDNAGDGFFVAFENAERAATCAIAIQRALRHHRDTEGFAPQVRIGLHSAEVTKQGDGYYGAGVHRAARIGALAGGGEIVASEDALSATPRTFEHSESRTVTLKGMSEPASVVTVVWNDQQG